MTTFHPGKQYKTRSGLNAGIDEVHDDDGALIGWVDLKEGRTKVCWYADGHMITGGVDTDLDLMPSTEDAPSCATDDRLDKLEAQCTDLFRWLRGNRRGHAELLSRLEQIDAMIKASGIDAMAKSVIAEFQQISNRVSKINEENAREFEQLTQRQQDASAHHVEIYKQIRALSGDVATMVEGINKRLAKLEAFHPHQIAVDHEAGAVVGCECYICQSNRAQLAEQKATPRKSLGWINIYAPGQMDAGAQSCFTALHRTRALADENATKQHRLACIEIFEGDGL